MTTETSTTKHEDCEHCQRDLDHAKATGSIGAVSTRTEVDGSEHRAEWQSGRKACTPPRRAMTKVIDGMRWRCDQPGRWRTDRYELERRRSEPDNPVGWYLFGELPSGTVLFVRIGTDFTESLTAATHYIRSREQPGKKWK